MAVSPFAGKPPQPSDLVDVAKLVTAYYTEMPDPAAARAARRVRHLRASRLVVRRELQRGAHPRDHAGDLSTTGQQKGIDGPLFLGIDTHALSEPALAQRARGARGQRRRRHASTRRDGYTPTPVISHAILTYNRGRARRTSPTASSSRRRTIRPRTAASSTTRRTAAPPTPTSRGGSRTAPTRCSRTGLRGVQRIPYERARARATTHRHDYVDRYVDDLGNVVDMEAIRGARLKLGVDPLGGASVGVLGADRRALRARPRRW